MIQLSNDCMLTIQYRWKLQEKNNNTALVYYGLRNFPNHTKAQISLSPESTQLLKNIDGSSSVLNLEEPTIHLKMPWQQHQLKNSPINYRDQCRSPF